MAEELDRNKRQLLAKVDVCALVEIGVRFPELRERAIAIGETLGMCRDYPVSKGCTSPFAPIAINALVSRQ